MPTGLGASDVELEVPARAALVGLVRLLVSALASTRRELDEGRVDDLELAVSEACTNAMEAHRSVGVEAPVTIRVVEGSERLEVHVDDQGPGFDPKHLSEHPPVTDPERLNFERGLGIPLIRTLVDDVVFVATDRGTSARLILFGGPSGDTNDMTVEILRAVLSEDD